MNRTITFVFFVVISSFCLSSSINMSVGDSEDKLYEIEGDATQTTELTIKDKTFVTYFYQATNTSFIVEKELKTICKISQGKVNGTCPRIMHLTKSWWFSPYGAWTLSAAHNKSVKSKGEIMTEPHWTSYIGMISGLVGVLVASFSLYKSSKIKTLDLRLELKRAVLDINSLHENLGELLLRAKKSRESMAAAMGNFKSGGMKLWGDENSNDANSLQEMKLKLPSKESTYKSKNSEELEAMLVEIHAQKNTLLSIKDKYIESMEKDVKDGDFLREQTHKRV